MFRPRLFCLVLVFACLGCTRERKAAPATLPLDVEVRADTAGQRLTIQQPAPEARIWVASVASVRPSPPQVSLPDAPQDSMIPEPPPPPMLDIDDDLKAPILKHQALLSLPAGYRPRGAESVELDVRVDENGEVTDALWAGGSSSAPLVQAATECALRMRFFPALQNGQPLPVWCRQRFDFARLR